MPDRPPVPVPPAPAVPVPRPPPGRLLPLPVPAAPPSELPLLTRARRYDRRCAAACCSACAVRRLVTRCCAACSATGLGGRASRGFSTAGFGGGGGGFSTGGANFSAEGSAPTSACADCNAVPGSCLTPAPAPPSPGIWSIANGLSPPREAVY